MATSLRDSPGTSGGPGKRRQRDTWRRLERPRPTVLVDPRQSLFGTAIGGRRRIGLYERRRRRLTTLDKLLIVALAAVVLFLARGTWSATRVHVTSTGLEREDALTFGEAQDLDVRIAVGPTGSVAASDLTLDGAPLDRAERLDDGFRWKPDRPLTAGEHVLELTVPRPLLPASRFTWRFVVDATPPQLDAPRKLAEHAMDEPVHVTGRVDDPSATLTANGELVDVDDETGRFALDYPSPPAGPIRLVARDDAGHVVTRELFIPIKRPRVRGVHMSAISWRTRDLRQGVFDLIDAGLINTVQLDLKDESGEVGYDSQVPLARRIGAAMGYYDLRTTVAELHRRGVRVIGRVVAFRDPILAQAAWREGHRDWVVQVPDGSPHGAYGGFTNMASDAVSQYNLDIAAEGVAAGMDEILWDYIRRPEGDLNGIVFPGMESTDSSVAKGVVDFLRKGHRLLRSKGAFQGASVFGVAAKEPATIGQPIPQIARHVDYLAPMVYPSLFVVGEYRVPDPVHMPFLIVARSLSDFQAKAKGTAVTITPWLQDFSLGATYGDAEVRQQIDAATSVGMTRGDWLLWSPRVRYHAGMLPRPRS